MYIKINSLRKVKMRETESGLAKNSSSSSLPHTKTSRKPVTQSIFCSCGEGKHTARARKVIPLFKATEIKL